MFKTNESKVYNNSDRRKLAYKEFKDVLDKALKCFEDKMYPAYMEFYFSLLLWYKKRIYVGRKKIR